MSELFTLTHLSWVALQGMAHSFIALDKAVVHVIVWLVFFDCDFHSVHGVLKARILKWFAIPFTSGPHSVRPLNHDSSVLGGPTGYGLVSLS